MNSFIKVTLKHGKDQSIRRNHPWVFSGAIQRIDGKPENGDIIEVADIKGETLGFAHYSEGSIAARIFHFGKNIDLENIWEKKISDAFELRMKLGLTGNEATTIYRLIHGEGDGLPGLIIDIYGNTAVIQCHSSGMYKLRERFVDALKKVFGEHLEAIYDKSAEKLHHKDDAAPVNSYLYGKAADTVAYEYGHAFKIDWEEGQKTGFFIDQRENRRLLQEMSAGKKVLNTFCYTGGFSVFALKGGAQMVHSLDSSQKALDLTEENIRLNNIDPNKHSVIKADAVEYLKNIDVDYDVIVLDPPAFAKHLSARHKAVQGYLRINEAAMRQIKPGGIIFTFSCSQAVDKQLFTNTVIAAAIAAKRDVKILHQLHQPADHPISAFHPEGEYLKGLVVMVR
jgi:23S rRNA (cytosine1962-C5)-methyltransferase